MKEGNSFEFDLRLPTGTPESAVSSWERCRIAVEGERLTNTSFASPTKTRRNSGVSSWSWISQFSGSKNRISAKRIYQKPELVDGLRRMQIPSYSETCLYDAVYDTLERLDNIDGKKAIFLLSTGLDTNISKHTYPEALKKAESSDTMIYAVSMGQLARLYFETQLSSLDDITFLQADNVMRSLAEATGGTAWFPRFDGEYPGIYQMVSANLRNEYSVGFVPKDRKTDGKFHKLRVEVPPLDLNHNGKPVKVKVRHKKGYYAPKS